MILLAFAGVFLSVGFLLYFYFLFNVLLFFDFLYPLLRSRHIFLPLLHQLPSPHRPYIERFLYVSNKITCLLVLVLLVFGTDAGQFVLNDVLVEIDSLQGGICPSDNMVLHPLALGYGYSTSTLAGK